MSSASKYGHLNRNWFDAVINKMGGEEAANAFLRGDLQLVEPERSWSVDEHGIIHFEVVSDGTLPEDWIKEFEQSGRVVGSYAKQGIRSEHFKPTTGVHYPVAVIPGKNFTEDGRITRLIRKDAADRKFPTPPMEVACLIRRKFTDKQIQDTGLLWIVTMHEPFKDSDGDLGLLGASSGSCCLRADNGNPEYGWDQQDGFAFLEQVPKSSDLGQ